MNLLSFDLNLLKVLDALLLEKSTTRAAARIGLSQPAVSAALGRLRSQLNDPLFVRQGQRLVATEFALSLEQPLRWALNQLEQTLSGRENFDPANLSHVFRLQGADYFTELMVAPLTRHLAQVAPGVRIHFFDDIFWQNIDIMKSGDIDFLLLPRMPFPEYLSAQSAFHTNFHIAARPGHPRLSRAQIAPGGNIPIDLFCDINQVRFSAEEGSHAEEDDLLAARGRKRNIQLTVPTFRAVVKAISETDLIGVVPALLAEQAAARGLVQIYSTDIRSPDLELCIIWHRRHDKSPVHIWLRNLLADILKDLHR